MISSGDLTGVLESSPGASQGWKKRLLLQSLNARAHVLHELRHPNTHFGSVAVDVEASVVRVYERFQLQKLTRKR